MVLGMHQNVCVIVYNTYTECTRRNMAHFKRTYLRLCYINSQKYLHWKLNGYGNGKFQRIRTVTHLITKYIQWRPLIIIADKVINQLLLSK
jgi:hypothetical protein